MTKAPPRASRKSAQSSVSASSAYVPPLTTTHASLLKNGRDSGFREVVYLMNTVLSRLQVCRESFGQALGLTGTQFAVLMGVAHRQLDHGVSIRALATHLAIAQPHVTTEVGRLVEAGLLQKDRHGTDKRSKLITLTDAGKAYVEEVSPYVQRVNDHLFAGISVSDFKVLGDTLNCIAMNSELAMAEIRKQKLESASQKN